MNYLFLIPRTLWKLWFLLNFLITLVIFYPLFFILLSREEWFPKAFVAMRTWAKWICYAAGIFPKAIYKLDVRQIPHPCVFVSNHSSYLDIVMSYIAIPNYFVFVGKQELDKAPLFRIFFKKMNILVNRQSNVHSHRAYMQAGQKIDKGESIFIFPEAGIFSANGVLTPFKNGAFKLAIDKQIPIVPIVFPENWKILQIGGFFKANGRPGTPRAIILPPVATKGMTNADLLPLRERVKTIIAEELKIA